MTKDVQFSSFSNPSKQIQYSTVPELRSRYSKIDRYTKLGRQVKQVRTANKNGRCSGAAHLL